MTTSSGGTARRCVVQSFFLFFDSIRHVTADRWDHLGSVSLSTLPHAAGLMSGAIIHPSLDILALVPTRVGRTDRPSFEFIDKHLIVLKGSSERFVVPQNVIALTPSLI
jgi:hypothetical protein